MELAAKHHEIADVIYHFERGRFPRTRGKIYAVHIDTISQTEALRGNGFCTP